jgi:hypothetical protein
MIRTLSVSGVRPRQEVSAEKGGTAIVNRGMNYDDSAPEPPAPVPEKKP